nr:oligoendopeptidase F family protein [Bacillota bacterium]
MGQLQRRDQISSELKWRLEDIYAADSAFEEDLEKL